MDSKKGSLKITTMNTEKQEHRDDENVKQSSEQQGHDLTKGNQPTEQKKPDDDLVHTVAPDNDSGIPGPPAEEQDEDDQ
ncbi:hypothetical protein GCM10023313_18770 [Mucilaginibacter defluvii]|uniref:Uncharacterized protein n=2 Tax=Mucilaginibacter defluvii TaxID=1196019 RepID=A0ABP9FTH2_9SPHI